MGMPPPAQGPHGPDALPPFAQGPHGFGMPPLAPGPRGSGMPPLAPGPRDSGVLPLLASGPDGRGPHALPHLPGTALGALPTGAAARGGPPSAGGPDTVAAHRRP
ncbi:hypothetical protein [Streptomyces sp. AC627_RSS907]|uniref:hypothetical protein n=1 Tax=Streptomyces sp. AC627_RSS907 TaxID=2823684 RepID=UPI001C24F38A|nr:hypothetical protein [Streptomyces sp. AC627_RSS907]